MSFLAVPMPLEFPRGYMCAHAVMAAGEDDGDGIDGSANAVAAEAAGVTIDLLQLLVGVAIGIVAAIAVGVILIGVGRIITRRHAIAKAFAGAVYRPLQVLLLVCGAWIGFSVARDKALAGAHGATVPAWTGYLDHAWGIALIVAATWLVVGVANGITAVIHERIQESSQGRAKRVQTQMQILHRVIVVVVWILGFAGVLLTFPQARTAGASLLASAGVVSVVAGLAAQTTLGNVFAGLQLAFSDSIRVGDVVFYNNTTTTVEEITLTYVVLAVWDGRRIIVPSSLLTTQSFENWTRRAPEMVGTVDIDVDWAVPVAAARKQLRVILLGTDLWDGKTGVLQVSNATKGFLQLRVIVSAKNSPTLSDLQNHVREKMAIWIQHEAPQAMPHVRMWEHDHVDVAAAEQASLAAVEARLEQAEPVVYLPDSQAPGNSDPHPSGASTQVLSPEQIRGLKQSLATEDTAAEEAEAGLAALAAGENPATMRTWQPAPTPGTHDEAESTIVMKRDDVNALVHAHADGESPAAQQGAGQAQEISESAIFSGSAEAEERQRAFAGPAEEVYEERKRRLERSTGAIQKVEEKSQESVSDEHPASSGDSGAADGDDVRSGSGMSSASSASHGECDDEGGFGATAAGNSDGRSGPGTDADSNHDTSR
ncbi:MAG: mechanosensitive ion channel [Actinomycetaceae bacterium]|nr:mechanosensitive ion channel family protein [Arcanobacterium sp.]MDD7687124.1 mechanosensitive ion channel [Actinomycetaceae bacterium]MDY5273211.1 mechanosensitive ion channel [Arcanobacterium sp.]